MKKKTCSIMIAAGALTALLITGCGNTGENAETEALKAQISQLEQQVSDLQGQAQVPAETAPEEDSTKTPETGTAENGSYTHTMEELTALVDDFVSRAEAAAPEGTQEKDLEQFFSLKQEENQIDDQLDLHEDELERDYRNGTLTREDYRALERELELLDDRLGDAEDQLEYVFGIDD